MKYAAKLTSRRVLLAAAGLALLAWIAADAISGRGPWTAAGSYLADLAARAGPTRDLLGGLRKVAGRPPPRPIVLRVWDWWSPSTTEDYADYFDELEALFESRHPQVDVVFQAVPFSNYEQKLATAMLGDNPPDVFQCSVYWAQGFYRRGMLRELNDLIAAAPELQDDQFIPAALYHSRIDGHIFGVPHIMDARCLLWNLEMLRAEQSLHGMFEPGPDGRPDFSRLRFDAVGSWEDFRRIARQLTKRRSARDGQPTPAGFEVNAYGMEAAAFMPWAAANGVQFQDHAGTRALFDTPAAAEALRFLLELYWTDRVCPPFRRVLTSHERFQQGAVACTMGGTWDGKYLVRNTQGWTGFGMTAFPPGPQGSGPKTIAWGNMMVISSRCRAPEAAWEYLRLVCGLEGSLLRLKHLQQNSPRRDFYRGRQWQEEVRQRPFLASVPRICGVGDPLHHTQTQAVRDEVQPIFEYVMLHWPEMQAGRGRFRDPADALHQAAQRVNDVYRRYGEVLRGWEAGKGRSGQEGS